MVNSILLVGFQLWLKLINWIDPFDFESSYYGYQLTPIDRQIKNVLILIWNIFFFLTTVFIISVLDPYSVNDTAIELDRHYKPLLSTAVRFNMIYMYSSTHIIYWLHFIFYGRTIFQLLDCKSLQSIYCGRRSTSVIIFVCFLSIHNGYFMLEAANDFMGFFNSDVNNCFLLFMQFIGSYSLYLDQFIIYGILYYYKYGILQSLLYIKL